MINQKSIAVLPFENISSDQENEYFADGMTEEIINALSKIIGLKVTARTSSFVFKDKREDVRIIGNQLGVSTVLEGSIRKSGDRIRITAQLIRTDNGFHLWSDNFDRTLSDVFQLQDEISLLIADKIRENFGHLDIQDHLVSPSTVSIEAYELYLKARFYQKKWNLEDIARGARYFEESLLKDPDYDLAYFGAGLCYGLLGSWGYMDRSEAFQLAQTNFEKGYAFSTHSPYAYHCMATHSFWGLWDYQQAFQHINQALSINPVEPEINECLAEIYTALGEFESAAEAIELSLNSDPLSPNHFYTKANIYYLQGEFEKALVFLEQSLKLDVSFALSIQLKIACYIHLGRFEELPDSYFLYQPQLYQICETMTLALKNKLNNSAEVRELVNGFHDTKPSPLFAWDLYLLTFIDAEEAIKQLEVQCQQRFGLIINFKNEPFFNSLKRTPTFQQLINKYFPSESLKVSSSNAKVESKAVIDEAKVSNYIEALDDLMEKGKYTDSELNLKELAYLIQLHPNKLSWLLNEKIGKNFNEYVNTYRIKAFQEKALLEENSNLTLLGLAYDSGFNSKSVFNDSFKKLTGVTPKQWINQQRTK